MTNLEWLEGVYAGSGSWFEASGRSQSYRIQQTVRRLESGFEITFKHDFEDASVVDAHFSMEWLTHPLFRVSVGGQALGNGYLIADVLHYHLEVNGAFVETSLVKAPEGLSTFGSSSKNKAGHYIAWHEALRRVE